MEIFTKSPNCSNCKIKSKAVTTLSESEINKLEQGCVEGILKKGERIFNEGMPPGQIVYLRHGFAKIHMSGIRGKDQILKIAKPGAYLGLQTILGDNINHYSATAINDIQACFIDIGVFKELIRNNTGFAYELIVYICQEELIYYRRFVDQSQKQLHGRLADAILFLSNEIYKLSTFHLPFTKFDLGALVGSTRESVTRTLKEFKDDGILEIKGKEIKILDMPRLERISKTG